MPKILLVEADELNRTMPSRRPPREGHAVVLAADGPAAAERPNRVLLGMSLPVMDGREPTRRPKAAPETRLIPIAALRAHATAAAQPKALGAGHGDCGTKPVESPRRPERIGRLVRLRHTPPG